MNIPRDLLLLDDPEPCTPADVEGSAAAADAWRAAEARVRRYTDLLEHPQAAALTLESVRRARLRLRLDPATGPVRAALEELHGLLADRSGQGRSDRPELDSLAARARRWAEEDGAAPRSAPPVRLRHMVPERYRAAVAAAQRALRRAQPDGHAARDGLGPTLVRSK